MFTVRAFICATLASVAGAVQRSNVRFIKPRTPSTDLLPHSVEYIHTLEKRADATHSFDLGLRVQNRPLFSGSWEAAVEDLQLPGLPPGVAVGSTQAVAFSLECIDCRTYGEVAASFNDEDIENVAATLVFNGVGGYMNMGMSSSGKSTYTVSLLAAPGQPVQAISSIIEAKLAIDFIVSFGNEVDAEGGFQWLIPDGQEVGFTINVPKFAADKAEEGLFPDVEFGLLPIAMSADANVTFALRLRAEVGVDALVAAAGAGVYLNVFEATIGAKASTEDDCKLAGYLGVNTNIALFAKAEVEGFLADAIDGVGDLVDGAGGLANETFSGIGDGVDGIFQNDDNGNPKKAKASQTRAAEENSSAEVRDSNKDLASDEGDEDDGSVGFDPTVSTTLFAASTTFCLASTLPGFVETDVAGVAPSGGCVVPMVTETTQAVASYVVTSCMVAAINCPTSLTQLVTVTNTEDIVATRCPVGTTGTAANGTQAVQTPPSVAPPSSLESPIALTKQDPPVTATISVDPGRSGPVSSTYGGVFETFMPKPTSTPTEASTTASMPIRSVSNGGVDGNGTAAGTSGRAIGTNKPAGVVPTAAASALGSGLGYASLLFTIIGALPLL